jgi:hypothetical protein
MQLIGRYRTNDANKGQLVTHIVKWVILITHSLTAKFRYRIRTFYSCFYRPSFIVTTASQHRRDILPIWQNQVLSEIKPWLSMDEFIADGCARFGIGSDDVVSLYQVGKKILYALSGEKF